MCGGNYKDKIISAIADAACKKIKNKVIRELQKMPYGLSGGDSGLENVWDEICVQVQSTESVFWELYIDTIRGLVMCEVAKLDKITKQAIWLQTWQGQDWEFDLDDDEEPEEVIFDEQDIEEYILHEVLWEAGSWKNERIKRYLDY